MLTVGVFANAWLYRVLGENGRNDLAYRLLTDESVEGSSMLRMVYRLKNETLNESFTRIRDSLNHMFLGGGPQAWIYRCLMGISAVEPGFKKYRLQPYFPNKLDNLDVRFNSPNGTIGISWRQNADQIVLNVTAPYNSLGCIVLDGKETALKPGINKFVKINGSWKREE